MASGLILSYCALKKNEKIIIFSAVGISYLIGLWAYPKIATFFTGSKVSAKILYEDDEVLAFTDISPEAPVHFLVIPKKLITSLSTSEEGDQALLGKLMLTAKNVAKAQGLSDGYRVVVNTGRHGCESVDHLHLHVLGGRQMGWPPGTQLGNANSLE